jgi:putative ABC transport system permease protein
MNLATIAFKNTRRNLFRSVLTILGVGVAMLAFLLLRTVLSAWLVSAEYAAKDRLATRHKVTFIMTLPKRYVEDVRKMPGVESVTWMNWFGARLPGHEDAFFGTFATDPESFLQVYDEISITPEQRTKWLENRRGALVGAQIAKQFGWKVGDKVILEGTIFPGDWEFIIEGVYSATRKSTDQSSFYFHYNYMNEALPAAQQEQIGWIATKAPDAAQAATLAKQIDQLFEPRDIQTLSMSERAMNTSFLGMMSTLLDAMQIVSLVILVIMMLILGNTIAMGVRERTREYGVLRAIGFLPKHLSTFVVVEAGVLGLLGGGLGLIAGYFLINFGVGRVMEEAFTGLFPYFRVASEDMAISMVLSVGLAVIASIVPAYQASKLQVTDALRKVG